MNVPDDVRDAVSHRTRDILSVDLDNAITALQSSEIGGRCCMGGEKDVMICHNESLVAMAA
jgi:hypothetical protein